LVTGTQTEISSQIKIVASIVSITALSGVRIYGTNYLKHKMYISIVHFFFNNICLQKLEHWDTYYTRSELVKCVHTDISALSESASRIFSIVIKNTIAVCITGYLLYKEHTLYLAFGGGVCILRSYFLEKIAQQWEKQLDKLNGVKRATEDQITEYIDNVDHMQIYGLNSAYQNFIQNSLQKYDKTQLVESKILAIFMTSFSAITKSIDVGLFLVTSIVQWNDKSSGISALEKGLHAQLILTYLRFLTDAFQSISDIPKIIKLNKDSFYRLQKYMDLHVPITTRTVRNCENDNPPDIVFKYVTFKYPTNDKIILQDFDFDIPFGCKIAIKGNSGVGKSTLIKLLLGLYTPNNGHVLIAGRDVSTMSNVSELVSIVPQEPIILEHKTLKENLTIFCNNSAVNEKSVQNALEKVQLSPFCDSLNERLVNLSGGQRLAVARAILTDAPIIVLDEPFSAMDQTLKTSLSEKLMKLWKDKTIILITHDKNPPRDFAVKTM
jgi:ABC-type multidrug transport system fused ATPase/permease subunit